MTISASFSTPARVVINTRPIERAAPLTAHLQAAGFSVVEMPMLALQLRPVSDSDRHIMRQWLAGDYQALVIVSPTAAASGLAVWQELIALQDDSQDKGRAINSNNQHDNVQQNNHCSISTIKAPSHIIAVGQATAAVLADERLPIRYEVLQPTLANNEGMLAMPEIDLLQSGDKLLVWRGLGGRRLLVNTLQARGVHIDSIEWYERIMPETASAQYQYWQQHFINALQVQSSTQSKAQSEKPIVIVSSGTAFEHWLLVVTQSQVTTSDISGSQVISQVTPLTLNDFYYVVLGTRLADMAAARQLEYWQVEDLAPTTILAAISIA